MGEELFLDFGESEYWRPLDRETLGGRFTPLGGPGLRVVDFPEAIVRMFGNAACPKKYVPVLRIHEIGPEFRKTKYGRQAELIYRRRAYLMVPGE